MKIVIPRFGDDVAPWFEVATHLALYEIKKDRTELIDVFVFTGEQGLERVRQLRLAGVNALICGGIGNKSKGMLQAGGVTVINNVGGTVEDALRAFNTGELCGSNGEPIYRQGSAFPTVQDLIEQTTTILQECGYVVQPAGELAPFPVDLLAQIICPVCGHPLRLAVCCGLHMYRVDDEIREFHHAAGESFDAKIYVHPASSDVEKACCEFGIQLLDFEQDNRILPDNLSPDKIMADRPPSIAHSRCFASLESPVRSQ